MNPGRFEVAPQNDPLLYFCGFVGPFSPRSLPSPRNSRVLNSIAAGRRLALRTVTLQAAVTLVAALVALLYGREAALGMLSGGGTLALGSLLAAWKGLAGGVGSAGGALWRLLVALALKWIVVVAGFYLAIAVWHLPPLAVIAGAVIAALAVVANMSWQARG